MHLSVVLRTFEIFQISHDSGENGYSFVNLAYNEDNGNAEDIERRWTFDEGKGTSGCPLLIVYPECFVNVFLLIINLTDRFVLIDFIITLDMATLLFRWTKVQAKEKAMYQGQCRRSTCHFGSRRIRNIPHSQTFTYVLYINYIHLYNI